MIKNLARISLGILSLATASWAGVTVNSPLPASVSGSPVHFVASASSTLPVTARRIYVDNVSVYANSSNALDVLVPLANGTHLVVIQAWDSSGAVFKASRTLTVAGGLSVSSPLISTSVPSPVRVVASASAALPITQMAIYLDNNNDFMTPASSLDTPITAAAGPHSLVVQAWDSAGTVYKQALAITVDSSLPANVVTKTAIQAMAGWENCTVCAGPGGTGPVAGFSLVQNQAAPALTGKSAQFNIWGTTPYADALWWKQLGGVNSVTNFKYDVDFYLTAPQLAQALEFT